MDRDEAARQDQWRPEALTRRNTAGELYRREPDVEQQICAARTLGAAALQARAAISDRTSADYLKEEGLVYLIRHYHAAGEARLVSDLSEALLRRCAPVIEGHLRKLGPEATEAGYDDVVERLFGPIVDLASDRGDFLQVRFWLVVEKLAVRAFNQQLTQHQRAQANVPLSSFAGYDHDGGEEDGQIVRAHGDAELASPAGDVLVVRDDLIHDALSRVDEPFRSAYLLRHYFDWPVEDQDPTVRTISSHFGKDPRTIRNWLKRAEGALETWRGEQQ
jgi:DNA-directed RNA polymerase specialized sigma24 family protein